MGYRVVRLLYRHVRDHLKLSYTVGSHSTEMSQDQSFNAKESFQNIGLVWDGMRPDPHHRRLGDTSSYKESTFMNELYLTLGVSLLLSSFLLTNKLKQSIVCSTSRHTTLSPLSRLRHGVQ